ncbi:hypothetical protein D3C78_1525600 [compost metagenome]
MPVTMTSRVIMHSGHEGRLWINGILRVRIICTISVCDSSPSTNQPDWNNVCISGVFALNTHHIRLKVSTSKIELIGPKNTIKRPISPEFQRCGWVI